MFNKVKKLRAEKERLSDIISEYVWVAQLASKREYLHYHPSQILLAESRRLQAIAKEAAELAKLKEQLEKLQKEEKSNDA